MLYLEKFFLPSESGREYPYQVLYPKMLDTISFSPITIFYGSNGSGKSTLLNVIAEKIGVKIKTKGNSSFYFDEYVEKCMYLMAEKNEKSLLLPKNSRFVRSEDIMSGIVDLRKKTERTMNELTEISNATLIDNLGECKKYGERELARPRKDYCNLFDQYSNGETAMMFFENTIQPNTLYFLDEPENSLSPNLQLRLKEIIESFAYNLNCQFIIASHSPFLLSTEHAKVYNLDMYPTKVCNWHELENVRCSYDFFDKNKHLFE